MRYYAPARCHARGCVALATSVLVSLLAAAACPSLAATIRVPGDQPTIQVALNVALPGDIVLVAPGTYSGPSNRNLDFLGKDVILRSETGAQATIIDCGAAGRAFYFHNGESSQAVVEGFTIQDAYASDGGAFLIFSSSPSITDCIVRANRAELAGGAAFCSQSAVSFTRCRISGNRAGFGGGLYFEHRCMPTLVECTIDQNSGRNAGGGVVLWVEVTASIEDCIISSNGGGGSQGGSGGGLLAYNSDVTLARCSFIANGSCVGGAIEASGNALRITDCSFLDNLVYDSIGPTAQGGAIHSGTVNVTIERCEFRGNAVIGGDDDVHGGAISSVDGLLVISDCLFENNQVQSWEPSGTGGALSLFGDTEISNCVFFRNSAPSGSAIHAFDNSRLTTTGCTFAQNAATAGGTIHLLGEAHLTAQQTIIAFSIEGAAIHCQGQTSAVLSCCDVFGNVGGDWIGCIAGQEQLEGNLALDPLFCDMAKGVLTLDAGSPCAPFNSGDCGLIGAFPVDCGVQAVMPTTWGRIKSEYLR